MKDEYLSKSKTSLFKLKPDEQEKEIIEMVLLHVRKYIFGNEQQEYLKTQHVIGIESLFKG